MKKLALAISAAALVAGGAAYADHHQGRKGGADTDSDGVVTLAEHNAHAAQMFASMDANSDGVINSDDRDARREARKTEMFDRLDADNNGAISRDEFMSAERPGKRGEGKHRMGMHGGKRGGGMMKMADTNNDGAISQAEFNAAATARFEKTDANNDGKISKEERQAAHAEMRGKWREKRGNPEG
ncbi:MAG: EF-hand domain-containing protein [Sphingomonadaceae bacterium]